MLQTVSDYTLPRDLRGTILERIMHSRVHELIGAMKKFPAAAMESVLERAPETRSFRNKLKVRAPAVIAEIKKASPSAGMIREDFDAVRIAEEYQEAGAAALSVVTEVQHFRGGLENLSRIRWKSRLPLLRKDFIIDAYQVVEARHAGADAVLLITALLDASALRALRTEAERLGMDALVEVHDEAELERALESGATLIGVNNRNLCTFEVSLDVSINLARKIPKDAVAVSESGIHSGEDLKRLAAAGYRGFLIGEHLMRAQSPGRALKELMRGV